MISFPDKNIPRWIIFIFDVFVSLFALAIAYALRFDFFTGNDSFEDELYVLYTSLPIFLIVRIITFYFGKTYAGIIRHTGIEDTKRIFKTVSLGTLIFVLFVFIRSQFIDDYHFLPISILAIEYLATIFLMISTRVAVKLIYHEGKKDKANNKDIVIYGAGKMGVTVAQTFSQSVNSQYNVVAFIDDDKSKAGKTLNGVKIYNPTNLDKILTKYHVDNLVLAILTPDVENENKVVDVCLSHNVVIMNVPPIEDWMNGELNLKQIKQVKIEDLLGRKEIELNKTKILEEVKNNVILVTGAAGSIGSEIVRQLLKFSPKKIVLLDQAETPLYDLEQELIEYRDVLSIVVGDISNKDRMANVFSHFKPQLVFHAAAYKHVPLMEDNPCEAILTNVKGTQNLVNLAELNEVSKFVMISTDKAVNPTNVMGASKRLAEIITQEKTGKSKTKYITTRFGNVLGSNGSVIPLFKKQIEKGGPVTVTHQDVTRYFMTIPEACQLVLEAGTMGKGGEIFVFDMGKLVKIIDLARRMIKLSGFEPDKDIEIKITGLRPGEKLYEELLSDNETTIATHHPQIMIGKVRETENALFNSIKDVIDNANAQNNEEVVKGMKKIIPEFISNNSTFNALDQ
jgi:FlaA1/EpsC-like NDP-sugar epimerase